MSSGNRRGLVLGLAAVAAYVVVALASLGGGHQVRPLFDGFAPPPPYRWVNPPKEFAAGNVKPTPVSDTVPLGPGGNETHGVATDDGQFVLNLPTGAIPPHEGDTSAKVDVAPVDAATLGRPPAGLRANGNAYKVSMAYQPSGQPVTRLAIPANLVLTVPEAAEDVLYSADGKAWARVTTQNLAGPTTPSSTIDQPGYYLGVTAAAANDTSAGGSSGTGDRVAAIAVITVVVAAGLWFIPALLRRRRRRSGRQPKKR